jgi:hypothetical protein
MKKLLMIAALMVASLSASAQEVGAFIKPMAGATLSTMTGDLDDLKMKIGFTGGVELGYQFHEMFALTAGALYTMQGARVSNSHTKYMINMNYLNVPVMLAVYPVQGFGIKAGAQFGFLMKAKQGDTDMKDFFKKSDFSIPVGLSYEFDDAVIELRYNIGLSNILKAEVDDEYSVFYGAQIDSKVRNSVIQLTFGYRIPF